MSDGMVVVNGVRYRREDAERLGLIESITVKVPAKARTAQNKARTPDAATTKDA